MKIEPIVVTVIISALIVWVQHWGIASVVRKTFHPVVNYTLGVLAIFVPLALLLWSWGSMRELLAMTVVVMGAGAAVVLAYGLDRASGWVYAAVAEKAARLDAEEREKTIMAGMRKAIGGSHAEE